jgi:hypothetical protein
MLNLFAPLYEQVMAVNMSLTLCYMCDLYVIVEFVIFMVCLGIEFLELELNSNSIYKYRGKKLCLSVEF